MRASSVRKLFNPDINMQLNAVLLCSFVRIVFKPMQLSFQRKIEAASGRQPVTQGIELISNIQIAIA